jgi:hypothetical protein
VALRFDTRGLRWRIRRRRSGQSARRIISGFARPTLGRLGALSARGDTAVVSACSVPTRSLTVTASRKTATEAATTSVPHDAGKAANRHGLITHPLWSRPSPEPRCAAKRETVDFFSGPDTFMQGEGLHAAVFSEPCCPNAPVRRPARDLRTPISSSA